MHLTLVFVYIFAISLQSQIPKINIIPSIWSANRKQIFWYTYMYNALPVKTLKTFDNEIDIIQVKPTNSTEMTLCNQ